MPVVASTVGWATKTCGWEEERGMDHSAVASATGHGGLLEAPLERRVLLDVLPVLVQRRRAYAQRWA